jgi:hypothetical protein
MHQLNSFSLHVSLGTAITRGAIPLQTLQGSALIAFDATPRSERCCCGLRLRAVGSVLSLLSVTPCQTTLSLVKKRMSSDL